MRPTLRAVSLAFALFGVAAASTSLYVHYQVIHRPGYASFCDINALFSCTDAYLSRYGSLFGVPTALLGLLWFAGVTLFVALAARPSSPFAAAAGSYLFVASTLALAWILYLAYAAFFILKAVCILCLATYVAVTGLFVTSGIAATMPMTKLPRRSLADLKALTSRPVSLGIVVLFLLAAGASIAAFPSVAGAPSAASGQQAGAAEMQKFEEWFASQPRVTVPVPAGSASVLIVKFTDYQCPSCAQSLLADKPIVARFESRFPGAVKLVAKNYPLETECNPSMPRDIHIAACEAAAAVVMARSRGRADALGEYFATNQALMSPASVREAARTVGLVPDYDAMLPRAMEEVKADVGLGRLLGIKVTPTYYFNGVRIEGGLPPLYFEAAVNFELRRLGLLK